MARLRLTFVIALLALGILSTACRGSFSEAPETEIQPITNVYIREIDAHITEVEVNGRRCVLVDDNGITCDWSQDAG